MTSIRGPRIPVRMNKKANEKSATKLSGDGLMALRRFRKSEMSQHTQTMNNAIRADMRRQLDWDFRDLGIHTSKLRRSQDSIYKDKLRLNQDRIKLARELFKKRQEMLRGQMDHDQRRRAIRDALDQFQLHQKSPVKPLRPQHPSLGNTKEQQEPGQTDNEGNEAKTISEERKISLIGELPARKLSSTKSPAVKNQPKDYEFWRQLHEEKDSSAVSNIKINIDEEQHDNTAERVTRRRRLPAAISLSTVNEEEDAERTVKTLELGKMNDGKDSDQKTKQPSDTLPSSESSAHEKQQSQTRESKKDEHSSDTSEDKEKPVKGVAADFVKADILKFTTHDSVEEISPRNEESTEKQLKKSLAIENRRRLLELQQRRKRQLDSEQFSVYRKEGEGDLVPQEYNKKEGQFELPSRREEIQRSKLLQEETKRAFDLRDQCDEFIQDFLQQELGMQERMRNSKHSNNWALNLGKQKKETKKELRGHALVTNYMVKVFLKKQLPDGVDPQSEEALQHCKYLRRYKPRYGDLHRHRPEPDESRATSWNIQAINSAKF